MKAAVDFKWQRTSWWIKFDLTLYVMSLVVASGAVLGTAWETSHPWEQYAVTTTDFLFEAMIGLELCLLVYEAAQIVSVSLRCPCVDAHARTSMRSTECIAGRLCCARTG